MDQHALQLQITLDNPVDDVSRALCRCESVAFLLGKVQDLQHCRCSQRQIPIFNGKSHCCKTDLHNDRIVINFKEYLFTGSIIFTQMKSRFIQLSYWNFCANMIIY